MSDPVTEANKLQQSLKELDAKTAEYLKATKDKEKSLKTIETAKDAALTARVLAQPKLDGVLKEMPVWVQSEDWKKGKSGIKATIVYNAFEMQAAGIDKDTAEALETSLNAKDKIPQFADKSNRPAFVVIKDHNDKPVQVLGGVIEVKKDDTGRIETMQVKLGMAVDLKEQSGPRAAYNAQDITMMRKPVKMAVDETTPKQLDPILVDHLGKRRAEGTLTMNTQDGPANKLASAADFNNIEVPQTKMAKASTPGKSGGIT